MAELDPKSEFLILDYSFISFIQQIYGYVISTIILEALFEG